MTRESQSGTHCAKPHSASPASPMRSTHGSQNTWSSRILMAAPAQQNEPTNDPTTSISLRSWPCCARRPRHYLLCFSSAHRAMENDKQMDQAQEGWDAYPSAPRPLTPPLYFIARAIELRNAGAVRQTGATQEH
eukprot:1242692-Rhodomonas_salina.1